MTWKKICHTVNLGEAAVDQCLYRDRVMILDEYYVDWNPRGYYERREMAKYHDVRFWKINPNEIPSKAWPKVMKSKKISLDYWLKHTPVMYDNYMLNFGIRWVAEEVMEFCMSALDLNCK